MPKRKLEPASASPASRARPSTCPLCGKFVGSSFLPLHASTCTGADAGARARPDTARRRTRPAPGAPPSERGAPGFHVFERVLSVADEAALLAAVDAAPAARWKDLRARRVLSYGPPWSHAERRLLHACDGARVTPLPPYVAEVVLPAVRAVVPRAVYAAEPNQLCVTVYHGKESFILPHSDEENDRLDAPILGLSLQAGTTMTLVLPKAQSPTGKMIKTDVVLPPRSLYVMSGDALHTWHHGIFAGKTLGIRYSLTLRRALPPSAEQQLERQKRLSVSDSRKRLRQSHLR